LAVAPASKLLINKIIFPPNKLDSKESLSFL
jgi:hypothetical protein